MNLAEKIHQVRSIDGGGLENSKYVEDLTALLLNINKIYNWHSSIKITS
jgi:predicted dinucleotide-binding enzyme